MRFSDIALYSSIGFNLLPDVAKITFGGIYSYREGDFTQMAFRMLSSATFAMIAQIPFGEKKHRYVVGALAQNAIGMGAAFTAQGHFNAATFVALAAASVACHIYANIRDERAALQMQQMQVQQIPPEPEAG